LVSALDSSFLVLPFGNDLLLIVRFTLEAILAIYFGRKLIQYMNSKAVEYIVYGLIAIAVVGSVFSILKWAGRRTSSQSTGATTADS